MISINGHIIHSFVVQLQAQQNEASSDWISVNKDLDSFCEEVFVF